jgi:hypothetical protein
MYVCLFVCVRVRVRVRVRVCTDSIKPSVILSEVQVGAKGYE